VVGVMVVGVRASTEGAALQNNNAQITSTTAATNKTLFCAYVCSHLER